VIGVAAEAAILTVEGASIALEAIQEVAMGRVAVAEMRAAEEANEEAIRTTEAARITGEVTMPATDNIRRMRRPTAPPRMATTIRPLPAARKHVARHSSNTTRTLSPRSCRICRHRPAYNRWQRTPTI